jgi:histidinol-phosphate aminotransferase
VSPSPVTFNLPTEPASYSWEATDDGVAERYGVPVERVIRFDLNTSPTPPALVEALLRGGRFETRLSEYPPGDYRRLVEAAAARYGAGAEEVLPGAGADEILELCAKAFLGAGRAAVIPVPSYAMYRVVTEQREAGIIPVPRLGPDAGWAIDEPAVRKAARSASAVWLCNPNNPTGRLEPDGTVERLLDGIATDAAADGRSPAAVVVDEAYAEFTGETALPLRHRHENLVVVRTASKAYALAGLRVGFAVAAPATLARVARYRPPGSVGTISATVVAAALRDPTEMRANVARVEAERPRLSAALAGIGWRPSPSATNFVLLDLGSPARAAAAAEGLMRQGLVPRTFGSDHPLAHCLRVTVRAPGENDRLVAAATAIAADLDAARVGTGGPEDGVPRGPGPAGGESDTTPVTSRSKELS